jgi:hypothetical protein
MVYQIGSPIRERMGKTAYSKLKLNHEDSTSSVAEPEATLPVLPAGPQAPPTGILAASPELRKACSSPIFLVTR